MDYPLKVPIGPGKRPRVRDRVARNSKWGHINRDVEFVTEPRFDRSYEFSEGIASVILDRRTGYVNLQGELAVSATYLTGARFSDGVAAVSVGTGEAHRSIADACEVGFIDRTGELVIPPRFFSAGSFQNGFCFVETEKEIHYMDHYWTQVWSNGWVELGGFDPYLYCLRITEARRNLNHLQQATYIDRIPLQGAEFAKQGKRTTSSSKRVVFAMGCKGGVGKTCVMVAKVEWFAMNEIPVSLLDLDTENNARGSMNHFFDGRSISRGREPSLLPLWRAL